ncbi:MAG: Cna B-type domain-containing protein, partial [Fimbriiglobus sp.]|nr:Cna B-type domain-containing protein [Fimbriiglobus sp.]
MTDRLRTLWSHWLRSMFANSPTRPITLVRPELLEDRAVPAVTGWVFQDFNANGTRDLSNTPPNAGNVTYGAAIDRGLGGVTVTAFDATGAVRGTAVSAANGSYTLNVSGSQTDPLRIEFTTLPAGFFAGPRGPDSGTTVQFVPDANATASVGLVRPTDFASDDPIIINTLFNYGPHNEGPNGTALYAVRYSAGGNGSTASNYTAGNRLIDVPKDRLGAVYGVAYDPYRRDVYASAYFKRHVGFGPDGTGAVYRFNYPVGAAAGFAPPPGSLLYADLNAIFGVNTAGPNQHDLTDENGNGLADDYDTDNGNAGWDAVGKTGLGGMDSSDDGQFVFVMNLFDRQLYRIPTSGPLNTTTIQRVSIPLTNPDTTGTIISPARFRSDDLRPFAVQFHQGRVYVGVTYTAETLATGPGDQTARDELMAAVYELNPATMTFTGTPVFTARLNYLRSQSSTGFSSTDRPPSPWEPWRPTYFSINTTPSFGVAPQAIFSDIAFDPAGNMTLGLRDRGSDQIGYFSLSNPNSSTQRVEGFTTGDMLQAFINTPNNLASGWTLENNARGPAGQGTGPQNNDRGPGGAEFYFEENFNTGHGETSMGALLQVPGFPDVVSTQMDPGVDIRSGGFKWMNTSTGAVAKGYQAYATTNGNAPLDTFGKANGLGGLTLVREFAPVEIGNRLFRDLNSNGVQDAGEPGLGGVTVELFDPATNTVIGSVTTAADGSYYFSNDTRRANVPGGNALFSATILPNTPYRVRIDRTQATLAGYGLSPRDNDPSTDGDNRDSDAFAAGTLAVIDATTGDSGQNAHTFDAGFTRGRIGDTVFLDANGNSLSDAGEGLPGVVLRLTADILGNGTTQTFTATTGANGFYEFTDLPFSTPANNPITYRVTVDPTTVVANVTQTVDPDGTLDNTSTTVLTEAAPNDPTRDFGYRGTASLGNRVWYDADGDGAQDASEPGIGGATVTATWFGANGVLGGGDDYNFTTTTAADGTYLFTGLPANALVGSTPNYRVQVTPPARFPTHTDSLDNGGVPAPLNPVDVQVSPVGGDPLNARRDVDFGYRGTARLGDRVWLDTNANGVQDGTEAGVNGVTVELFFDANNDGVFDAGELAAPLLAATTAGGGLYAFTDLAAGNYRVRFGNTASGVTYTRTSADSTLATDATDSDANTATGFTGNYTLALGDNNPTVDAGLYLPVSIGDTVWYDTNGNGTQEATESGIPGVVLVLDYAGPDGVFNSTGDVIGLLTVTTGANGTYTFPDLAPGTYRVRVQDATVPLSPFTYTTPSGNTQTSTPTSGNNDLARDFGIRGTGTIGDTVFLDPNANGQPDAGEGLAGVVVRLTGDLDGDGVVEANETLTATTNAAGFYQCTNLRTTPGGVPYTVTVDATTLPQGAGAPVANTVDPNGANDNTSISTISTAAPNDPTQDFGYRGPGAIGDTVFLDVNANGTPDAGEGLTGVTVRLTADVDGNGTTETFTATTDATGNYRFEGLPLADRLGNPIQYRVTVGAGLPTDATNTTDPDGVTDATSVVTLTTANPVNLAQDFGYRGPGSIGDRVFLDLNANGVWEAGEGLNGVTVVLTADVTGDGLPDLTVTATTGPDGFYLFENLPATTSGGPVQYTVRVVTTTLPTGVGNTADPDGVLDSTWTGDLFETVDNPNRRNADFGYRSSASLGDRVWLDRDGDGVQGVVADEPGLAGVRVTLTYAGTDGVLGTADDVTTATTTDAAGNYSFGNLPVGSFQVVVDPTTLPANVAQTFDFDGLGTPHTAIATLTTGQNRTDIDFGYRGAAALGDRVWLDQNRNGGQDPGEAGIPGAVVQLELAGRDGVLGTTDDLRFTATTAANGVYNFAGLPIYAPGGDAFRVTVVSLPAGGVAAVGDLDSAPGTGDQSATGTLGANQTRTDVDFGYAGSGVIRGSVYVDLN